MPLLLPAETPQAQSGPCRRHGKALDEHRGHPVKIPKSKPLSARKMLSTPLKGLKSTGSCHTNKQVLFALC